MRNPFEGVKLPPDVEAFIDSIAKRLPRLGGTTIKDRELRRLALYRDSLEVYEAFVRSVPSIDDLHPFYRTSLEIVAGDLNKVKVCLASLSRGVRLARRILKQYMAQIRASEEEEANKLMRAGFGRASGILRKRKECVKFLRDVFAQMKKLMAVDPELPTIIIAGPPNVGKSTLVSRISSAKPEVASYPFTTKEIHVGHIDTEWGKVQVIDTPGILDRPMSERNPIEFKAINAIKNLNGIVVFLFDVSQGALYSAKEQIDLFEEVSSIKRTLPALNKIDWVDEGLREEIASYLKRKGIRFLEISAEKGIGVEELKGEALKELFQQNVGEKKA
ncbi:MAG: 50S ribosome-binding GTPase [Sulfolobus sp.]|nr:50S ribosome-binding GTPase [Sulfolobus sp.]